ncbi:MAG: type II toxin-antitoxin system RelE/ParE family toxin [Pseudobdellovibrionaceae bacterium]|jgi:plasmid maintenance system killer protein
MIKDFGNKIAFELFHKGSCKGLPRQYWRRAIYLLDVMEAVESLEDLKSQGFPPSIRLHPLMGIRKGDWAIDINKLSGWRITFQFIGSEFVNVKIEDYH